MSSYSISLAIQIVSYLFSIVVIAIGWNKTRLLFETLWLEVGVNTIQLAWYVAAPFLFSQNPQGTFVDRARAIPPFFRYLDWVVTTPLMLVTMLAVGSYAGDDPPRSLGALFDHRRVVLFNILLANLCMLAFGFAAEFFALPKVTRTTLSLAGFLPFAYVWGTILIGFTDRASGWTWALYLSTCLFWAAYGVAAHFPWRATAYNFLDAITKNVYSIIIGVTLLL